MDKLSKSNQDPRQVERDGQALEAFANKKSTHFDVGTYVIYDRLRWEVLSYHGDWVLLSDGQRRVALNNPYFMQGLR